MRVTPYSEKQIQEMNIWPEGEYGFEITEAKEARSKIKEDGSGGNEMIELTLKVFNHDGGYRIISDYLVSIDSMAFKIRHIAEALGMLEKYENGQLSAVDFVGGTGYAKVTIQKDKKGQYPDKNVIKDYIVPEIGSEQVSRKEAIDNFSDPLPWEQAQ